MSQLLSTVRNALRGVSTYGTVVANRVRGVPTVIINPAREAALQEHMRFYAGISTLRTSPFHYNYTEETREMRMAYRKWAAEPTVKSALLGKAYSVASLDLHVTAVDKSIPREQEKADCLAHALRKNDTGFSGLLFELIVPALQDGWSLSEPVLDYEDQGRFRGKVVVGKFKSKDTRFITPVVDAYRNIVGYYNAMGNYARRFEPDDFVYFSHLPMFRNPTGTSDLRAAYRAMQMIPAVLKLRMIFLDKYIGPFLTATVTNKAIKQKMASELEKARNDGFIVLEQGASIQAIDLATRGTADFQAGLDDLRKEAATAISGAFLHMMTAADPNARGDSGVQQDTVDLFVWFLAEQAITVINHQLAPKIIGLNYGFNEAVPECRLEAVRPSDIVADLAIDEALDRMGVDTSKKELLERARRSPPKDATDSVQAAKKASQPPANPLGGGNPYLPQTGSGGVPTLFSELPDGSELVLLPNGSFGSLLQILSAERMRLEAADPTVASDLQILDSFAEDTGFTGKRKDRSGREYCYQNGRRVPCPKDKAPTDNPLAPGPGQEPIKAGAAPVPYVSPVQYNHKDASHPIAQMIQADAAGAKLVGDFHDQFVSKEKAYQKAESDFADLLRQSNELEATVYPTKPFSPEQKQILYRIDEQMGPLKEARDKALAEREKAATQARDWLTANVKPVNPSAMPVTIGDKVHPDYAKPIREGVDFAKSITGGVDEPVTVQSDRTDRPYYSTQNKSVNLWDYVEMQPAVEETLTRDTTAHEIGHHIEMTKPGLLQKAHEFLAYRCGDEPFVPLNSVAGGGYSPYEVGRKDNFDKVFDSGANAYYVGKRYGGNTTYPTEVISMGLEQLSRDPIKFAERDPEYFHWLISVLRS